MPVYLNDRYYTKEQMDEVVNGIIAGEVDLRGYVNEKELAMALTGFIKEIKIQYIQTDNNDKVPDHGENWLDNMPIWNNEKFIWQRLVVDYGEGEDNYSNPVCISGSKGETGEKGQSLISITPQWCLNNDGNWTNFIPDLSEFDTVWIRHELQWEYPTEITYTPEVQDFIYEKVKELFNRITIEEENSVKTQEELNLIKENIVEIEEDIVENYATKDELENAINTDRMNLIKNGDFYYGERFWKTYGGGSYIPRLQEIREYPYSKAMVIQGEPTYVQYVHQIVRPMTNMINQDYSVSCIVNCDDAADGYDMPLCGLKVEVYHNGKVIDEIFAEVEYSDNEWHRLSTTFKVEQTFDNFECYFYVRDTSKTLKVTGFMFEHGNLVHPFKINTREIQDAVPTLVSQLENDSNYISEEETLELLTELENKMPTKVSNLEQDIPYLLEEDINHLTTKLETEELKNNLIANIEQTASQLASDLDSKITQTAEEIRLEMNDMNTDLNAKIESVSNANSELDTKLSQVAEEIRTEMSNMNTDLQVKINELRIMIEDIRSIVDKEHPPLVVAVIGEALTNYSYVLDAENIESEDE